VSSTTRSNDAIGELANGVVEVMQPSQHPGPTAREVRDPAADSVPVRQISVVGTDARRYPAARISVTSKTGMTTKEPP
jgi:hypothetical protein